MKTKKENASIQQRYKKVTAVLDVMFCVLLVADCIIGHYFDINDALYLTVVCAILSLISGYIAFLHSRLPKKEKEKANWLSLSSFNIHPYWTFAQFVLLTLVGLCFLLR